MSFRLPPVSCVAPAIRALVCLVVLACAVVGLSACAPPSPVATPAAAPPAAATPAIPAAPPTPPVTPPPAPSPAAPPAAATAPRSPAVPPLVGHVSRAQLGDYDPWAPVLAQTYAPDPAAVASIKAASRDVTVLAIIATWCPDSKRELPRFFAIMDASALPESILTMVGVDRTKKDAEGLTEKWGITRVPTFVFLRSGQEIGRFVERVAPESTLEREVERILRGQEY